jgi:SAM-dependent methyltransferase
MGARAFDSAMNCNLANIRIFLSTTELSAHSRILDLGSWDGITTRTYLRSDLPIFGLEGNREAARQSMDQGIRPLVADLNRGLPIRSSSVDVVTSNQVIEHLADTDILLSESYRVLRSGGTFIVSTENSASWHNIFALLLGWQAFSLTNVSSMEAAIGNPLANLIGEDPPREGWQHLRIFSYRGLRDVMRAHNFRDIRLSGAGYYPLPAAFGRRDPRHSHFITAIARRP